LVYKLVLENLKHRIIRTILSTLAIGLGVTMMLTLVGVSTGMLDDQKRRSRGVGADIVILPPSASVIGMRTAPMSEKFLEVIGAMPHVALTTGTTIMPIGGISSLTGIDFEKFNLMSGGFHFLKGEKFKNPDDILIDEFFAQQNKLHVGSTLNLGNKNWRVCGIVESGKLARSVVDIKVIQELSSNTGRLSVIYVKVDDQSNLQSVIDALNAKFETYKIYSMEEFTSQFSVNSIPELRAFIGVIIGLSVLFGFLVVFLSMYTAVLERTREIGVLKALGASPGYILGILLRETALLSVFGSIAGIAMSFGTRWLIATLIPAAMTQDIVPEWWAIAGAITLVSALIGVLYPALKAARQDALESLSYD
jgi:putative ABC transport system permease protein